jgi:hypothetical protein
MSCIIWQLETADVSEQSFHLNNGKNECLPKNKEWVCVENSGSKTGLFRRFVLSFEVNGQ